MCKKMDVESAKPDVYLFEKGNEPKPMAIRILAAKCLCGDRDLAYIRGGTIVFAYPV